MVIDLKSIRRQLDLERRVLAQDGCVLETLPYVSRIRCADREQHVISFSSLPDELADAIIAEQASHYRSLGAEVEWKVYQHDSRQICCNASSDTALEPGIARPCLYWTCKAVRVCPSNLYLAVQAGTLVRSVGRIKRAYCFDEGGSIALELDVTNTTDLPERLQRDRLVRAQVA
jgi:hypothetical protein